MVALLLPNIALCYTECLAPWACGANVLLPLALYMWFFLTNRCPGKMIWWAFSFCFFAAFQLVLLYLFGTGVIAVDMFLNLVTTNPGEGRNRLIICCLLWWVFCGLSSFAGSGVVNISKKGMIVVLPAESASLGFGDSCCRFILSAGLLSGGCR